MKKILALVVLSLFLVKPVLVFAEMVSRVTLLQKAEITKLSDDKLVDAYEDVLVELEAIRTFHLTSGFTPKQYDEYRDLLKFRLDLLMEIHNRNLELPPQMGY